MINDFYHVLEIPFFQYLFLLNHSLIISRGLVLHMYG